MAKRLFRREDVEKLVLIQQEVMKVVIRDDINKIRTCDLRAFKKKQAISQLVIDAMKEKGRFVKSTGGELFWFHDKRVTLHDLGSRLSDAKLNKVTGLNPTEPDYKYLKVEIELECIRNGCEEEISRLSRYDHEEKAIYIYLGVGKVVRLNGREIEHISNGDGCLFAEDGLFEPVNPIFSKEEQLSPIVSLVKFNDSYLSRGEIELLWKCQLYGAFAPDLLPAKPLMHYHGKDGSGKTTLQRIPGYIIYGSKFDVTNRLRKEDAFDAAVCSSRYLALDNLTKCDAWMEERLKTISTGTTIRLRKLYTTNELVTYFPNCLVSISSIKYPYSNEADTLSRLVIFEIERPPAYISNSVIKDRVLKARDRIWGQVLLGLNAVLGVRSDRQPASSSSRLADFFGLVNDVAETTGQDVDMTSLINRMEQQRLEVAGKGDSILKGLREIIPAITGQEMDADGLCKKLAEANVDVGPISLGKKLPKLKPLLENAGYKLHIKSVGSNRKLYLIEDSRTEATIGS